MKKFKFLPLFLAVLVLALSLFSPALAIESPTVAAKAAFLAEAHTGTVLFEMNADTQLPIASTTKIMTALLAIEACENGAVTMDDMVTATEASQYDLAADGSSQGIVPGETMSLKDLIYCAMVASANEACNIIAEYISGNIQDFIALMNTRALELGCTNTHFSNTHGLPDDTHYSSARDLYLITRHAMTLEAFRTVCGTSSYTAASTNMNGARHFNSTNRLLTDESGVYGYEYATGVKTGSTNAAGYCLVSAATKDDVNLICVVLGAEVVEREDGTWITESFTESRKLFQWGFENFSWQEVLATTDLITEVPVYLGDGADTVVLRPQGGITAFLPNDFDISKLTKNVSLYNDDGSGNFTVTAPVVMGEELGEMTLTYGDYKFGPVKLVANRGVELSKLRYMSVQIKETMGKPIVKILIVLVVLLFLAYFVFVILYNHKRRKQRSAMKRAALEQARLRANGEQPPRQDSENTEN